ncbi:MAG: aldehyde dehydrogenase family protein, partial [Solirubrobacterales bacterium]|nr:aldehyde dehydrogenase family protein [Solirubrobacterales bacterium]
MPTLAPFANEPVLELRRAPVRAQLEDALVGLSDKLPLRVPVMVEDSVRSGGELLSTYPGAPDNVVAVAARATDADVNDAVAEAERGFRAWRALRAEDRAAALVRAAAWLR